MTAQKAWFEKLIDRIVEREKQRGTW